VSAALSKFALAGTVVLCLWSAQASAQSAAEREQIETVLAQLRTGESVAVPLTPHRHVPDEPAVDMTMVRAKVQECTIPEYGMGNTINNPPGISKVFVNFECAERGRFGLVFSFENAALRGIEVWPRGVVLVPPPAPPLTAEQLSLLRTLREGKQ
jgi:hypothetical protein